jgi:hypothetical protein
MSAWRFCPPASSRSHELAQLRRFLQRRPPSPRGAAPLTPPPISHRELGRWPKNPCLNWNYATRRQNLQVARYSPPIPGCLRGRRASLRASTASEFQVLKFRNSFLNGPPQLLRRHFSLLWRPQQEKARACAEDRRKVKSKNARRDSANAALGALVGSCAHSVGDSRSNRILAIARQKLPEPSLPKPLICGRACAGYTIVGLSTASSAVRLRGRAPLPPRQPRPLDYFAMPACNTVSSRA